MRTYRHILTGIFFLILLGSFAQKNVAYAASTVLSVSPQTGSYNAAFPVDVVIDGHGDAFNAAEATASISASLAPQNLILGDCNFSFVKVPSVADPSFKGVLLGKSLKKCTVYTLTVAPVSGQTGTITLTNAQVLRFGDAKNILTSTQNGSYTLTGIVKISPTPTGIPSKENLYSVVLTVLSGNNEPVQSSNVSLQSVATKESSKGKTDANGITQFANLQPGVYTASVDAYEGENIINISGNNHTLSLGIKVKAGQSAVLPTSTSPMTLVLLGVIAVLLVIIVGGGGYLFLIRKK